LLYRDGQWSEEIGPDIFKLPLISLKQITPSQKPSCTDILKTPPPPPSAPGHSLNDTYKRTIEILQDNKNKGITDSVALLLNRGAPPQGGRGRGAGGGSFGPLPVCYSISDARKCDPSGETVVVPGDLKTPHGFWDDSSPTNYFKLCGRTNGIRLEVILTDHPPDGRQRYMSCPDLSWLKVRRTQLLELGVKLEDTVAIDQPDVSQSAVPLQIDYPSRQKENLTKGAPGHSLNDTYEKSLEIEKENESKGIPDGIKGTDFLTIFVCSSITARGQCQRTGETIRFPGDLAMPQDWAALSVVGYCRDRISEGVEVVLKTPLQKNVPKRFLRCADALYLNQTRQQLTRLGARE